MDNFFESGDFEVLFSSEDNEEEASPSGSGYDLNSFYPSSKLCTRFDCSEPSSFSYNGTISGSEPSFFSANFSYSSSSAMSLKELQIAANIRFKIKKDIIITIILKYTESITGL